MDGEISLRFFHHILWIDPNKTIRTEASHLIWMYGPAVEVFEKAVEAVEFIRSNSKKKLLVLCASREVQSCYRAFCTFPNIYPKYIVFCGHRARANQMKSFSPLRDAIEDAFWEIGDLIQGISDLEEEMIQQPDLMRLKVTIPNPKEQVPVVPQSEAVSLVPNPKKSKEEKKQETKEPQKTDKKEKKQEKVDKKEDSEEEMQEQDDGDYENEEREGAQEQSTQNEQKETTEEDNDEVCVDSKVSSDCRIIWVCQIVDDEEDKVHLRQLKRRGYPVHSYNTEDDIKYMAMEEIDFNYYLIAKVGVSIQELKVNVNSLPLIIRLGKQNEREGLSEDENFASSVDEIINLLKEHNVSG